MGRIREDLTESSSQKGKKRRKVSKNPSHVSISSSEDEREEEEEEGEESHSEEEEEEEVVAAGIYLGAKGVVDTNKVLRQPTRRTRPRSKGEIIGDFLVYGDSITWGLRDDRFERAKRTWATLLQRRLLEKGFRLVQSNFPERTTKYDDNPPDPYGWNIGTSPHDFNGLDHFGVVFSSHSPLWVVVFLGLHDLKTRVRLHAVEELKHKLEMEELYRITSEKPEDERDVVLQQLRLLQEHEMRMKGDAASSTSSGSREGSPSRIVAPDGGHIDSPEKVEHESSHTDAGRLFPFSSSSSSSSSSSANTGLTFEQSSASLIRELTEAQRRVADLTSIDTENIPFTADMVAEACASIGLKAREMFDGHCHEGNLKVVLVVPPQIHLTEVGREFGFDEESVEISSQFPQAFQRVCKKNHFLLAWNPEIDMKESVDGIHFSSRQHRQMAQTVWQTIKPELPRPIRRPRRLFYSEHGMVCE